MIFGRKLIFFFQAKTSDFSPEELEFRIKRQLIELKENFSETSDEINARIDSLEEENYELKKNLAKISSNFSSLESSKMIMEEELARRATEISSMNMSYLALAKKQQDDLTLVKKALVPIGFIYTQYPNQSPPNLLWPDFRFQEVTNNYAGLFFRAEGSGSAPFGQTQAANQSEIASIWTQCINNVGYRGRAHKEDAVTPGVWSVSVCGSALHDMRVFKTRGEVRPKNTAIKIWKRVQ